MELIRDVLAFALVSLLLYMGGVRFLTSRRTAGDALPDEADRLGPVGHGWLGGVADPDPPPAPADSDTYRARYTGARGGWDPYDAAQSRAQRARDTRARAKARPERAAVPTYYSILGVAPDASTVEIERAYRRHAARIHPDRFYENPALRTQAEAKLRQLNEAAEILRDPERRAQYDAQNGIY